MPKKPPIRAPEKIRLRARELRQQMTPAEAALWERLRRKQLAGLKFRRQHPIERFIVDFYCPSARLIVEVDGEIHRYQEREDAARDAFLTQRGYRILRFQNDDVLQNIEKVLEKIKDEALSPGPSPNMGEGSLNAVRTVRGHKPPNRKEKHDISESLHLWRPRTRGRLSRPQARIAPSDGAHPAGRLGAHHGRTAHGQNIPARSVTRFR